MSSSPPSSFTVAPLGSKRTLLPGYSWFGSRPQRLTPSTYAWLSMARARRRAVQWAARGDDQRGVVRPPVRRRRDQPGDYGQAEVARQGGEESFGRPRRVFEDRRDVHAESAGEHFRQDQECAARRRRCREQRADLVVVGA